MTVKNQLGIVYDGFVKVERFEREGHTYEAVRHPGAVCVVPHDGMFIHLVKQFRPVVGKEMLELPAGTIEQGEDPLDVAMRELAEECGLGAAQWQHVTDFYSSPGYTDELVRLFFATRLFQVAGAEQDEDENVRVVKWKLTEINRAIRECESVKCKLGLMMLAARSALSVKP